ncbi:serine hydrolase [Maribacter sp. 2307ULW6-5]|uniref:serine hydrolase n=1 Tax=Maribacter sp. 2307ULW6-5 TaxID=3386275 RepID=UPI0039BCF733
MKTRLFPFLVFGCLFMGQAQAQLPPEIHTNLQQRIDQGVNTGIVVGIIDANGTNYHSFGVKSLKTKEAVDPHSIFEIGSITKVFTGILLANMVLKERMTLEDPIQNYLPEGVTAPTRKGASIQLVHLANHTAALPRMPSNFEPANPANPFADYSEAQLYDFLNNYTLRRDIGAQYEYSNYAMGLLGHVLALANKMDYEALLAAQITKPLGLAHTGIQLSPIMEKNLALGHSGGLQVENWDLTTLAGAGAIRSNAVDMLKFLGANMGLEKSDLYPAMQLSHLNSREEGAAPMVGLGWHIMVLGDTEIVWHNGGTGGYRSFAGFVKGGNKGVVVLSNSNANVDDIGMHILHPESPLQEIKPSIANKIKEEIRDKGLAAGLERYAQLKQQKATEYEFGEAELNRLAHDYVNDGDMEKALAIFKLNTTAYPRSSNAFGYYGAALMYHGDRENAISSFLKSVELNPANPKALEKLEALGVDVTNLVKDMDLDEAILESYVGQYELAPNFMLTISREGSQLKLQATNQPEFPIFPKSENTFYLKVVDAQITFHKDEDGRVDGLTLHQNGQDVPGKKLE